ncbi:MAG TPA: restriction endonuclease subunit S [Smithellaceae bacterium]|jgi:type I restriction enzyme S subunit|nr:restriction endonuclease subunit S [Smithellaceae bacterium]HPM09676.1 restriction endonuclease subunit S [Paludibacter sp.]
MSSSLRELSDIEYGASPKEIRANDRTQFGIYGTSGFLGYATKPLFNGPLVVVARKGTLDNPVYVKDNCWVIDTAFAVLPKKEVESKWLYYQLSNYDLKKLNESTGVPSISRDYLYRLSFLNPGRPKQRKAVRILTKVDQVIEETEKAIEKLKNIKQGMMHDLFTRGIDVKTGKLRPRYSETPELYKETELGWIPKEWNVVTVKDYGSVVTGNTPSKNNISNWGNDFLWASPFDFYEKYIYDTQTLLSIDGKKCARIASAGAVLITCIASLGKNAIAAFKMAFNQQINAVIVNQDNDNEYFYYNILHDGIRFSALAGQTAVPIINKTTFEKFKITRALLPEQKIIANRISKADEYLLKTKKELNKYETLKQGLMQDLLTGKVEVSPDPQDEEYQEVS